MATIGPTSVSPVNKSKEGMAISKIVLYAMIGAIAFVLIIIIILVIFLCKRRKKDPTAIKDPSMQMKILDDDEANETDTTILCGRAKKKSKKSDAPLPETLPVVPPYEPGTMMEGVYERISSADMDTKYDVSFLEKPNEKLEDDINTYVSIGRSNSFNPKKDRPIVKRSREEYNNKVKRNESIKCIETGIAPSETDDIKVRVQELTKIETNTNTRVKQKRTSTKKQKANSSPTTNSKTHELVKITPPNIKKDLNKTKINVDTHKLLSTNDCGKPASVSGASVVSSNDSEVTSNLGTDSGYEDINSESSPTAKRIHLGIEGCYTNEKSSGSPISSLRRNYIDVDIMPGSMLLQQRSNSIIERRNSQKPEVEEESSRENSQIESRENSIIESTDCIYTQVTVDPHPR